MGFIKPFIHKKLMIFYVRKLSKITKTIIDFAKSLNLKTIAEFVENEEIFKITKELGADYSQGYFFSAPIAEPNIKDFKEKLTLPNEKL